MCGALAELRRNAGEVTSADHMEAWGEFLKGTLLLEQLAIPQAAAAFLRSVELNNSPARTWFWLGRSQQLLGEAESAIRAFDECLKRNPDHQRALRYRSALSASKADIPNTPPPPGMICKALLTDSQRRFPFPVLSATHHTAMET